MRPPSEPLFVARRGYRRRRLEDAARLMPLLGAIVLGTPLLWATTTTRATIVFVFVGWAALIVISMLIGRALRHSDKPDA